VLGVFVAAVLLATIGAIANSNRAGGHPAAAVATATTSPPPTESPTRTPTTTPTATPTWTPVVETFSGDAAVQKGVGAVDALDARLPAGIEVGVAVQDRKTGKIIAGKYADQQFYSASVVKLFLITEILADREAGELPVSDSDISLMQQALSASNDNAMDALWEQFDGPTLISDLISMLHLTGTTAPTDTAQWGETLITARDTITVYDYVLTRLDTSDRGLILDALAAATPDGADGFDQSFGLLDRLLTPAAKAKQGWMSYGPEYLLHTTGLLGSDNRYVVALLTSQPAAAGWDAARTTDNQAIAELLNK
jgi:hypothetical protein